MSSRIQLLRDLRKATMLNTERLSPEEACEIVSIYEQWDPNKKQYYDGTDSEHPQSKVRGRTYPNLLYKCQQSHASQSDWEPSLTPALWTVINETNSGTIDDPIPASAGFV